MIWIYSMHANNSPSKKKFFLRRLITHSKKKQVEEDMNKSGEDESKEMQPIR